MFTVFLHNTTTSLIDDTVNKTLSRGDYCSLSVKFSSMIESLLNGTPYSIIHGIEIWSVWEPHVKLDEVEILFFRKSIVRIKGHSIDINSGVFC